MARELLYTRVVRTIEKKILNGQWEPGSQLPTVEVLSKQLGVSHATLREAIRTLVEMDMLYVKNGVGTFVQRRTELLENSLTQLNSVGDMIELAGHRPGAITRHVEHVLPDDVLRMRLHLEENEKVVKLLRIRTADDKPIAVSVISFPEKLCKNTFDAGIPGKIFDALQEHFNVDVSYAICKIKAVNGTEEFSDFARRTLNCNIVLMEQLHYTRKGIPVFFACDYINTDIISLKIKRKLR